MDVFEDKESAETGSLAESESPPMSSGDGSGVLPEVMNMAVITSMEKSLGAAVAPAAADGGVVVTGVMNINSESGDLMNNSVKKKRGRPRKYDSDGNLRVPYIKAAAPGGGGGGGGASPPPQGFTLTNSPNNSSAFSSSTPKRGRGRPSGSGNCQIFASLGEVFASTAGGDFTPHVATVYAGEDVAGKILSLVQKGSRGICVLSANGSVSNVTIRQPGSSGGILTYEGRFEILSLTGSYTTSENGGIKSKTGGLSVSLAGPDGRVIGGGVAGLLMAASPIQIVFGSFMPNGYGQKPQKRKYNTEPKTAPVIIQGSPDPVSVVARPSQAAAPESNVHPTLPPQLSLPSQGEPGHSFSNKGIVNSTATNSANWSGSAPTLIQRSSPDINLSIKQH